MTNHTTTSTNSIKTPIKVALVGLTMIQQALLKFYFATQEGSQRYIEVLGKDADAYITNFDEQGAIEAWENLYSQENKPTLVLSDCRKTIDCYLYFPRPITPDILINASDAINDLLALDTPTLMTTLDEKKTTNIELELSEPLIAPSTSEHSFDAFLTNKQENTTTDLTIKDPTTPEIALSPNQKLNKPDGLDILEEFTLSENQIDFPLAEEKTDSGTNSLLSELELDLDLKLEEASNQTKQQEKSSLDSNSLLFDTKMMEIDTLPLEKAIEKPVDNSKEDEKLTSPDELQSLLDELNDKPKKQQKIKKTLDSTNANGKKKEQQRWKQLCGSYSNDDYKNDKNLTLYFKLEETLLPYIRDTIAFTKRAQCWMELAYKPLSIIINPEDKLIYSNLSLENPLFVQICSKGLVEELIEYLEVDPSYMQQIQDGHLKGKLFTYELKHFIWTISLLISHGRLPEGTDLDHPIGINNWLTLGKVERFPYIMQIAAVFNQHYASLNEATTWMTLPKRYIYAFYNGVLALGIIDKTPKSSKKKLITRGTSNDNNESLLKNLLFKKK